MGKSSIEWTNETWNPVAGCTRVSAGCDNCYAAQLVATRLKNTRQYGGLAVITGSGQAAFNGVMRLLPERLEQPLRWRKPRMVFVNSMSDLFHESIPDEFIDRVFAVMVLADRHVFQVLTKRPERMRDYCADAELGPTRDVCTRIAQAAASLGQDIAPRAVRERWPLRNVWLGTSCENQPTGDERIPLLLDTPAAVRFVSAEPLLAAIDLRWGGTPWRQWLPAPAPPDIPTRARPHPKYLSWVIVGGESGPRARPMDLQWARDIVAECRAAHVPVFMKQIGPRPYDSAALSARSPDRLPSIPTALIRDRKGGDPKEWPIDLRVREWPTAHTSAQEGRC